MRRLIWSQAALRDLSEAFAFIARASPGAAHLLADRIDAAAETLRDMPAGRLGRVSGTYEKVVLKTPYLLSFAAT